MWHRQPGATGHYPLVLTGCRLGEPHRTATQLATGGVVPPMQAGRIASS